MAFDLPAYLERIALKQVPEPTVEGLQTLQRHHRLAIPFENLDAILGRTIHIDSANVFDKLVTRRRGGFCFEQNRLFADALAALGFEARPLLGRVQLGMAEINGRTHVLSLVSVAGEQWIADVGFGGSYSPPMPFRDGAEVEGPDGARFRLERDTEHGWRLLRHGPADTTDGRGAGAGWQLQCTLSDGLAYDSDLAMGAHFAATHPSSRFVQHRVVTMPLPTGFASLIDRNYRRRSGGESTAAEITDPRVYRMRLGLLFGLQLSAEEVAGLGLF